MLHVTQTIAAVARRITNSSSSGPEGIGRHLVLLLLLLTTACGSGQPKPLSKGDRAPDFTATTLNGAELSLAELEGRPVLLRFFLTECKYCENDTEVFNQLYEKYRTDGLAVIYLNNNAKSRTEVEKFVRKIGVRFPVIYDPDRSIADRFHIRAQPLALLLNPELELQAAFLGGVSRQELEPLLIPYIHSS